MERLFLVSVEMYLVILVLFSGLVSSAKDVSVKCQYIRWKKSTVCQNETGGIQNPSSRVQMGGTARGSAEKEPAAMNSGHGSDNWGEYNSREQRQRDISSDSDSQELIQEEGLSSEDPTRFCRALGSPPPPYVAVVARWDENVSWTSTLPIPTLVYEHAKPAAMYSVRENKGSETSSYLQYILDHYDCLPTWTLFLHGHGRTASFGTHHGATRHHPTDPAAVASLLDVKLIGKGFLGLGHLSEADWKHPGYLHEHARRFSDRPQQRQQQQQHGHHAAFEPVEKGKIGCTSCRILKQLLPNADCKRPWGWNMGR